MDGIILRKISVDKGLVKYKFETKGKIAQYFTTNEMFIEYDNDISNIPVSILTIPFVSSILPLMWLTDTVLWVEEIDRTFYDSLTRIKIAYQNLYNHYPLKGNFVSARLVENSYKPEKDSLLLFSGGLDAHTTYIRIKDTQPMLFNIQGWYEQLDDYKKDAEADFRDISAFAKRENIGFRFAKSNFAVLINNKVFNKSFKKKFGDSWWHGFQHSMSFISIAIPLAYQNKIKNIYIASSVPMGEYVMCASHVTTDSEFKFSTVGGCIHDGSELTRQDKAHIVVSYQKSINKSYPIRVCSFNDRNCCACDKCFRTVIGIVAEGGDVRQLGFDIEKSLKEHFNEIMENRIIEFNIAGESSLHWPAARKRMKENYASLNQEQKDFVDWFLNYDFKGKKKEAVRKYRMKNWFKIILRRISQN